MTHEIAHQYDEILPAAMPGLEIHVVYECASEISYNEYGDEESNRLLTISAEVNGVPNALPCKFPEMKDGRDAQYFLARLRASAGDALYAQALRAKNAAQ